MGLATPRMRAKSSNNEWHRVKKTEQQSLYTALKSTSLPWTSLSISQMKCDSNLPCGSLAPAMADIPAQQRAAFPQPAALTHGEQGTELLQAHASDSDMASPWAQPAGHDEFVPCLWRARLKTDAGAGHWRNSNMAKVPRYMRTGIENKDRVLSSWWRNFLNF